MAIDNMHQKFGEDRTCNSEDMTADRQTHTDRHAITILRSPIGGGIINGITFEDGESDILRNENFQLGAERLANFTLQHRRLGEPANQKHVLEF